MQAKEIQTAAQFQLLYLWFQSGFTTLYLQCLSAKKTIRLLSNSSDLDVVELQAFIISLTPSQAHTFSLAPTKQNSASESKQENRSYFKYLQQMELNNELFTQRIEEMRSKQSGEAT